MSPGNILRSSIYHIEILIDFFFSEEKVVFDDSR